MGLRLIRVDFEDLLTERYNRKMRRSFLDAIEEHLGQNLSFDKWTVDDESVYIGSYTKYGIFWLCLWYLVHGDYEDQLEENEDLEYEALECFREELVPRSLDLPISNHFLETSDADTVFLPLYFDDYFEYDGWDYASLHAAMEVLECFAKHLEFNLMSEPDEERDGNDSWMPIVTAINVARTLYQFFSEDTKACVAFI